MESGRVNSTFISKPWCKVNDYNHPYLGRCSSTENAANPSLRDVPFDFVNHNDDGKACIVDEWLNQDSLFLLAGSKLALDGFIMTFMLIFTVFHVFNINYFTCCVISRFLEDVWPFLSSFPFSGNGFALNFWPKNASEQHFRMYFMSYVYDFVHRDASRLIHVCNWSLWPHPIYSSIPGVQFHLQLQILVTLTFSPLCYTIIVRLSYDNHVGNETPRVKY